MRQKHGLSIYYVCDLQQAQETSAGSKISLGENLTSKLQQHQAHSWFNSMCSVWLGMVNTDPGRGNDLSLIIKDQSENKSKFTLIG